MASEQSLGLIERADVRESERPADASDTENHVVAFGPLSDLAGFMLRLAQLQVYEAFFAEFDPRHIRPGQIGILVAIASNPGIRQGVLADALRIKWSNMAKIVRLLAGDGLIERRVPASDRRAIELTLTPMGSDLIAGVLPALKANDRATTAMLSDGERETLMRLLRKMAGHDERAEGDA